MKPLEMKEAADLGGLCGARNEHNYCPTSEAEPG
jgi:hypothetical protein